MTDASAYTIEEVQKKLEAAYNELVEYLRKSSRSISAKKNMDEYENGLKATHTSFEKTLMDYPNDEELKVVYDRFSSFYTSRTDETPQIQKEKISQIVSDFKSLAHWRKMETSYGGSLGFSDFRSLRGDSKKR